MVKKVLVITYFFPPRPGVASLRLEGLAKYLPEFGWEPTILTAKLPSTPDPRYHVIETKDSDILVEWKRWLGFSPDKTFRDQLGQTVEKDTYMDYLLNAAKEILAYPDYNKKWYQYTLPAARELLKREKFDAIISSSGPSTVHMIAHTLKKESGIPWIADFRDLWTQYQYYSCSRVRKYFETKLEIRTLSNADILTTVSAPLANQLYLLHHLPSYSILNGFDPDLLNSSKTRPSLFSITYTGRIYRSKMDPEPLFKVITKLINDHRIDPSDVEIHFWGCAEIWIQNLIDEYNLNSVIFLHDAVPHAQALEIQRRSQVLLLITENIPREEGLIGGKIFEYLAARKPILAIGYSKGGVKELLDDTQAGIAAETEKDLEDALINYYHQFKTEGHVRYCGIDAKIAQYSHREMASKFACLLDQVNKG
jgi:glycosyltransferase involved in cell wall biosynthesis